MGKLVSPSKSVTGGLNVSDVLRQGESVTLLVRKSKTDPFGKGTRVVLGSVPRLALCPVTVLQEWSVIRPPGEGPLFIHEDGLPLPRYQFVSVFKRCLEVGGFL